MADNLRKYTTQEVLNKVFTDTSGNAIGINSSTTKETLNAVFSTSDNSLNVALSGGTISGDVTISGDLTVNGNGAGNYDEIINGNLVLSSGSKLGIGIGDADPASSLEIKGSTNTLSKITLTNTNPDPDNTWSIHANYNSQELKINGDSTTVLTLSDTGNATFAGDVTVSGATDNLIHTGTSDASDNKGIRIDGGGGGGSSTRGGYVAVFGNEHGSEAGEVILQTGNVANGRITFRGDGGTDIGVFNKDGNFGIGVSSLETQNSDYVALQLGGNANIIAKTSDQASNPLNILQNAYNAPDTNWKKIIEDQSSRYSQLDGVHAFFTDSGTGSADSVISWTTNFVIDSNSRMSLSNNDSGTSNTVFGYGSGANLDAGSNENVFIGHQASGNGTNNDSVYNVGIGFKSLFDLAGGDGNVAIGHRAMFETTEGQFNIGIGKDSLKNLTSGSSNVAIGTDALGTPTTAEDIIAIGRGAAYAVNNDTADGTVAVGRSALTALTSGASNTAIGFESQLYQTNGASNTSVGYKAFRDADNGESLNTVIGMEAGEHINHASSDGNTLIGAQAGTGGTGARSYNTVMGYRAMGSAGSANNITADENVFIGAYSGNGTWVTAGCDGNTAVGYSTMQGAMNGATNNTAVGKNGLLVLTTGDYNTIVGGDSGKSINTGSHNVTLGADSLANGTDVEGNVAIGSSAMYNSVSPDNCVAIGRQAIGTGNNTQDGTIAVGYQSLKALTSGAKNIAIGYKASTSMTTGNSNIAIGYEAFDGAATGETGNIAIGQDAMSSAVEGASGTVDNNIAIGSNALYGGTMSGSNALKENIAIGKNAMGDTGTNPHTGTVAIGHRALALVTSGSGNLAVGYLSALNVTTGADNVGVGEKTIGGNSSTAITGDANTAVGWSAGSNLQGAVANNTLIGKNAGFAMTTGSGNVAVGKSALDSVTTSSNNTAIGLNALHACGDSYSNVAVGKDAGDTITNTGAFNTVIGTSADVSTGSATNQVVVGYAATGTGNNEIALGNTSISAIKAQVASITAYSSDERTKKDIADYDLKGVDFIKELNLKTYVYKNPADFPDEIRDSKWDEDGIERPDDPTETQVGLIAQEVESALERHSVGNKETYAPTQESGIKTLTYGNLIFPLIKAVQELSARVEELENQ